MKKMILIIVLIILLFLLLNGHKVLEKNEQISCYDYIVEIMSAPQYWDEYQMLPYSTEQLELEAKQNLTNGTGWKLLDEHNVVFARGNQTELLIDFVEFKAENRNPSEGYVQIYDFNQGKTERVYGEERYDISSYFESDESYHLNPKEEIRKTMENYEQQFSKVGCPILNQKKGILEEYKNVLIDKSDLEKAEFQIQKNIPLMGLAEAKDVLKIQIAEDEPYFLKREDTYIPIGYYAPIFLYVESSNDDSSYFEDLNHLPETMTDFVESMVTPALNSIFDETRVYKVKSNQFIQNDLHYGMDIEDFMKGISVESDTLVVIYWYEQSPQIGVTYYLDSNISKLKECIDYINELAEHYQKDVYITNQDLFSFELRHNLGWQRLLGLR